MKQIKTFAAIILATLLTIFFLAYWLVARQGVAPSYWEHFDIADVVLDDNGIPTISTNNWDQAFEAQGYVIASERMWQMDLIRRKGSGSLAEWFGNAALSYDKKVKTEDRRSIVEAAYSDMTDTERKTCDSYARGINRFIDEHENKWGLEYLVLRTSPEKWHCTDSLLTLMVMCDELTRTSNRELTTTSWHNNLSPEWFAFLFPLGHPWNRPYFDSTKQYGPSLPPHDQHIELETITPEEKRKTALKDNYLKGSNGWLWRGETGHFLANDPHLGISVPSIWYAMRLRVSEEDWLVGVAIPGIPGITIGMNPYIAWGFTNVGEDVDDLLLEKLNEDKTQYLASVTNGKEIWLNILKKTFQIKVKGEETPQLVEGWFTHRGPLKKIKAYGNRYYSRQWLPLKKGMLHLPTSTIGLTRNWKEFNTALDEMTAPAQNAIYMDFKGNIGYRATGTGVVRKVDGIYSQPALEGEWQAFESPTSRKRFFIPNDGSSKSPFFFGTANERKWISKFHNLYGSDDRKSRIMTMLSEKDDFKREDMERLQMDTKSRFRKTLLTWLVANTNLEDKKPLFDSWNNWDGDSIKNPIAFTQAAAAEKRLTALLLSRVKKAFFPKSEQDLSYDYYNDRGWITQVLIEDQGLLPFGLDKVETANYLIESVSPITATNYAHDNRSNVQHPFVGRVPIIGNLFKIKELPQHGSKNLVRAERPHFGPSVRMVWDLSSPIESTWVLPTGQSGHIRSKYYKNFQKLWLSDTRLSVFDSRYKWKFASDMQQNTKD